MEAYGHSNDLDQIIDSDVIDAAHRGNVAADAALFHLKVLDMTKYGTAFDAIYKIGSPINFKYHCLSAKATEIINLRGTVELCVHHPDKSLYKQFLALEKKCKAFFIACEPGNQLTTAVTPLAPDRKIESSFLQMQEMAARMQNLVISRTLR